MLFLSIGLPGRFAEWCDAVLARLAGISGGTVLPTTWPPLAEMFAYERMAPTLDEIGRILIETDADHLVIGARQPDAHLCAELARSNTRFLVALDDPRIAAADVVAQPDVDSRMAVRAVANSCPFLIQFTALGGALTLRPEAAANDPADAVLAIARHFGVAIDAATATAVVADIGTPARTGRAREPGSLMPTAARKMLDGALLPYSHWFVGGPLEQITWTRELFHTGAENPEGPTGPIGVAGGSRILMYGPYIQLPAGSWTAQVVLGFCPEAAGFTYLVDAFAGDRLAVTTFQPSRAGIHTAQLSFSLGEPSGKGIEVRVMVISEDARGQIAFGHVTLQRVAARDALAVDATDSDFLAALKL